jgi:hypothetical protein
LSRALGTRPSPRTRPGLVCPAPSSKRPPLSPALKSCNTPGDAPAPKGSLGKMGGGGATTNRVGSAFGAQAQHFYRRASLAEPPRERMEHPRRPGLSAYLPGRGASGQAAVPSMTALNSLTRCSKAVALSMTAHLCARRCQSFDHEPRPSRDHHARGEGGGKGSKVGIRPRGRP